MSWNPRGHGLFGRRGRYYCVVVTLVDNYRDDRSYHQQEQDDHEHGTRGWSIRFRGWVEADIGVIRACTGGWIAHALGCCLNDEYESFQTSLVGFAGLGSDGCSRVGSGSLPGSLGTSCGVCVGGCCGGLGSGLIPGCGTCCGITGFGAGVPGCGTSPGLPGVITGPVV